MKKVLIVLSTLFLSLISSAENFRFAQWSGRIDIDGLQDLNRIAQELFPEVKDGASVEQAIRSYDGSRRFEKLQENISIFVKSKGFYLHTAPSRLNYYDTDYLRQVISMDNRTIQADLSRATLPHPLVERALVELFNRSTKSYFESANSNTFYKVVDNLIVFIPIFGAFYGAKRLQDNNFGPVADAQKAQTEKYDQLQKCAYAESLEGGNGDSLVSSCQVWGEKLSDGREAINKFREILDYSFVMNLMTKIRLSQMNCQTSAFGGTPSLMDNTANDMARLMYKYQIKSEWLTNVMENSKVSVEVLNSVRDRDPNANCPNTNQ